MGNAYGSHGTISLVGNHLNPADHTISYATKGLTGHMIGDFDASAKHVGSFVAEITGGTGAFKGTLRRAPCLTRKWGGGVRAAEFVPL